MTEEEQPTSDSTQHFSLSLSVDRDNFFRRTCPSCGRDFKTDIDEADLMTVVGPQIRRIGREIGAPLTVEGDEAAPQERLFCPYCGHHAEAGEMLPEETVRYLHRHLMREVVLPMFNNLFSGLEDRGSRRPGGFISIRIEHTRSLLPPRPIHGPEPPDMKIVELLCCGKKVKVAERWNDLDQCPYCGTPVTLV